MEKVNPIVEPETKQVLTEATLVRQFASHHGSLAEALACEICTKHGAEFCEFVRCLR